MGAASTIFYTFQSLVWCGWDSNPQPLAPKEDTLPTELSGRYKVHLHKYFWAVYIFIFFLGGGGGGGGQINVSFTCGFYQNFTSSTAELSVSVSDSLEHFFL